MGKLDADLNSRASRAQAMTVALMVGLSVMSYVDRTIMSIASPPLIREFRLTETEMGSIYSAFILTYALLMIPGGRLADRLGPRLVLTGMSFGAALFTVLTALAGRTGLGFYLGVLPSFLAVRLALGACTAPLYPACGRITANWFSPGSRARVQGLVLAGAPLGGAITPVIFSGLIALYGWRFAFYLAGAATAALAVLWLWYVRDHPAQPPSVANGKPCAADTTSSGRATEANDESAWGKLLANPNVWLLTFGYFTIGYFEIIFFYWIYYYFGEVRHLGLTQSAVYTTALLLTMMLMMPLAGWASDRLIPYWGPKTSRRTVSIVGMVLSAALLYLGTNVENPLVMVTLLSLALGFAASSEGPFWASAIDVGGSHAGAAGGILNAGGNLGALLAPVLTPFIAERAGWSMALYFGSCVVLAGAVSWLFVDPAKWRTGPAPQTIEPESKPV